ncbi:DNA mismatch repair protein spellchecker 1 [Anopheles ziemanni]|uniref:DNA mismatch repair protein spellchecker 1 n=1 Tax=Anopheles coustani TaxID=139045 RepID=UPI00265A47E8|nr:DNA mismatch repair protein spellchecker 1 [Anopheles coustani]XP_058177813.1 DNA mismatch repair protein spellchecker 1 [Anopheles ziemanni]
MSSLKPLQCLNLDKPQQKAFIEFYKSLGEKPATTIRLFDRIDYYSCHGEDAAFVAKLLFKSTNFVKIMESDGQQLAYVSLSKNNFEALIRELLLVRNYRVDVYTKSSQKKLGNEWTVEFKGSPGNLAHFEDVLFNSNNDMISGSALIALQVRQESKNRTIGLGFIDVNERRMAVVEFVDDDFYTELEALIVILGPKECLLPSVSAEYERIQQLMNRNNVIVTLRKKKEFALSKEDIIDGLNKLLRFRKGQQQNANTIPETSKTIALQGLGATINYLELVQEPGNHGHYQLSLLNAKRYVHLDAAAVSALNLFPKPGTPISSNAFRWHSVLGVLDRCRTPQGHRLMAQWIKQPLRDYEIIKDRHDIVECFVNDSSVRAELYNNHLNKLPDILLALKRLLRRKASLQDIFRLYQVVLRMPKILSLLDSLSSNVAVRNILYDPIKDILGDLKLFKSMVEQIIDLEAVERGEYMVKATFDSQLEERKEEMDAVEGKMKRHLSSVASDIGLEAGSSIKLEFVSHHGFHFRITVKDETLIRKNNRYRILDAVKGGVRFTTDSLSDMSENFSELKEAYEEQQQTIVAEVVRVAAGYVEPWTMLNNQIAQLDCLVSFAVSAVSAPIPYVRPTMHRDGRSVLKLSQIRHPCLELQEDVNFIANDVMFDEQDSTMYIITGPNMGGKSTYIRSVGVAVLMAHVGAFVACDKAEISIMDSILGRVGADDNLSKGLSTFMVEMVETAGIVRGATNKSLVIIDELGRGTSTYEGCGIAWSIAEWLAKESKCFTLFATHFQEITDLATYVPNAKNSHMEAIVDGERLTLLYQVKPGIMEKSFGIQVAKLANFPPAVVELAQKFYNECEDHQSNLKQKNDCEGLSTLKKCFDEIDQFDAEKDSYSLSPEILESVRALLA